MSYISDRLKEFPRDFALCIAAIIAIIAIVFLAAPFSWWLALIGIPIIALIISCILPAVIVGFAIFVMVQAIRTWNNDKELY